MTEKRYKSISTNLECSNGMEYMLIKRNDGVNICQVCSKYTAKEIVDELNSLADENKELKSKLEESKKAHSNCDKLWWELHDEKEQLEKENEELKSELKIYRKVANCRNCDYHDYDCREDGDDFEICKKGNDVTEGICEDWREL